MRNKKIIMGMVRGKLLSCGIYTLTLCFVIIHNVSGEQPLRHQPTTRDWFAQRERVDLMFNDHFFDNRSLSISASFEPAIHHHRETVRWKEFSSLEAQRFYRHQFDSLHSYFHYQRIEPMGDFTQGFDNLNWLNQFDSHHTSPHHHNQNFSEPIAMGRDMFKWDMNPHNQFDSHYSPLHHQRIEPMGDFTQGFDDFNRFTQFDLPGHRSHQSRVRDWELRQQISEGQRIIGGMVDNRHPAETASIGILDNWSSLALNQMVGPVIGAASTAINVGVDNFQRNMQAIGLINPDPFRPYRELTDTGWRAHGIEFPDRHTTHSFERIYDIGSATDWSWSPRWESFSEVWSPRLERFANFAGNFGVDIPSPSSRFLSHSQPFLDMHFETRHITRQPASMTMSTRITESENVGRMDRFMSHHIGPQMLPQDNFTRTTINRRHQIDIQGGMERGERDMIRQNHDWWKQTQQEGY